MAFNGTESRAILSPVSPFRKTMELMFAPFLRVCLSYGISGPSGVHYRAKSALPSASAPAYACVHPASAFIARISMRSLSRARIPPGFCIGAYILQSCTACASVDAPVCTLHPVPTGIAADPHRDDKTCDNLREILYD